MANDQGVISVRFSPDEAHELRQRAAQLGVTVSEYLRVIARDTTGDEARQEMASRPGATTLRTDTGAQIVIVSRVSR